MNASDLASRFADMGIDAAQAGIVRDALDECGQAMVTVALDRIAQGIKSAPAFIPAPLPSARHKEGTLSSDRTTPTPRPVPTVAPPAPSPLPTKETCSDPAASLLATANLPEAPPAPRPAKMGETAKNLDAAEKARKAAEKAASDAQKAAEREAKAEARQAARAARQAEKAAQKAARPEPTIFRNVLPDGRAVITTISARGKASARIIDAPLADAA